MPRLTEEDLKDYEISFGLTPGWPAGKPAEDGWAGAVVRLIHDHREMSKELEEKEQPWASTHALRKVYLRGDEEKKGKS